MNAHTKREIERQILIEGVKRAIYTKEEEWEIDENRRPSFFRCFIEIVTAYMIDMPKEKIFPHTITGDQIKIKLFCYDILFPSLDEFARSEEEKLAMLAIVLKWLTESFSSPFHSALQRQEIYEPEKIFHAPNAMHEVEA